MPSSASITLESALPNFVVYGFPCCICGRRVKYLKSQRG
uniref:Uncharacterized protein n=1 Tax=Arundo donax TaxID=35708 RepID=A0A0A8Y055_ARUDO